MKVLVSGSSGLIGTELIKQLKAAGHQPIRLVRTAPKSDNEFQWSPQEGKIPEGIMEEVDAVVNLNGATTSRIPWTPGYVKKLISSRLLSTRLLVEAINAAKTPPKVFVSGSAEGYYGNGGDKVLTSGPWLIGDDGSISSNPQYSWRYIIRRTGFARLRHPASKSAQSDRCGG